MKKLIVIPLVLLTSTVRAENKAASPKYSEPKYQVLLMDTTSDTKEAAKFYPGAEVHNIADSEKLLSADFLSLHDQKVFFEKAGLTGYVKTFDQMDKDLLVGRLRRYSGTEVHKSYKNIPVDVCTKAREILRTF